MMKYTKILVLLVLLFGTVVSCKKKVIGTDYKDFPNGRYIGVFVFDSFPELNYTKEFVGRKTYVITANGKGNNVKFDFFNVSELDSVQNKIELTSSTGYMSRQEFSILYYQMSISGNSIVGKQTEYFSSYPDSFTLIYTP